jgi:Lon-like ATP-dependent protease
LSPSLAFSSPSSSSHLPLESLSINCRSFYASAPRYFADSSGGDQDGGDEDHDASSEEEGGGVVVIPSKLPFGEGAPRFPHMHALPLVSRPLFPGLITTVTITDPSTIDAFEALQSKRDTPYVSCFLRKKHSTGVSEGGVILSTPEVITSPDDIYHTGTFAQIQRLTRGVAAPKPSEPSAAESGGGDEDGHSSSSSAATLLLLAHRRVDLKSLDDVGPPIDVTVTHWPRTDYAGTNDSIRALSNEILSTIREVAQLSALFRESLQFFPMRVDANDPFRLADFAASISSSGTPDDLQAVLEERDPERRLHKALLLLNREKQVSKLQQEISKKVEEKMTEQQRKYFLNEQLKSIKKELGMERDDKEALIEKYRAQLAEYPSIPAEAMEVIQQELDKFSTLEKNSPEFNVTRSYLDWLVGVPWGVATEENFDLALARKTLDRDHYGLDDVKNTIMEFIAVGKLKGTVQGKILCLSGPPGTGS